MHETETKTVVCWHSRYDIADVCGVIDAHEQDGYAVDDIRFGYDKDVVDNPNFDTDSGYYVALKLVKHTPVSVLGSGFGAEGVGAAGQAPVTLSESPSDALTGAVREAALKALAMEPGRECGNCKHVRISTDQEPCLSCIKDRTGDKYGWIRVNFEKKENVDE